jgi:hypothetical protein
METFTFLDPGEQRPFSERSFIMGGCIMKGSPPGKRTMMTVLIFFLMGVMAEPLSSTPEQFAEFIKKETMRYGKVIKEANLSIE